jgi:flagellar assembly protein FliH
MRQELRELLLSLGDAYRTFCLDQAPSLAAMATNAAGRLFQEQLSLEPERALAIVHQALEQAATSTNLCLHLHPADLAIVQKEFESSDAAVPMELQIVADASVQRGGCWLETGHGEVDATVSGRLERLARALDEVG